MKTQWLSFTDGQLKLYPKQYVIIFTPHWLLVGLKSCFLSIVNIHIAGAHSFEVPTCFCYGVQHIPPKPITLCVCLCFFILFLCLHFTHCLNSPMPSEFGRSYQLASTMFVPSNLISEHRSLHCDQWSPPRIIYQLLWCSLPDIIL